MSPVREVDVTILSRRRLFETTTKPSVRTALSDRSGEQVQGQNSQQDLMRSHLVVGDPRRVLFTMVYEEVGRYPFHVVIGSSTGMEPPCFLHKYFQLPKPPLQHANTFCGIQNWAWLFNDSLTLYLGFNIDRFQGLLVMSSTVAREGY